MPQEWDPTLSLTPGISPPHVFHNILYLQAQSATRQQHISLQDPPTASTLDFTSAFHPEHATCSPPSWLLWDGIDFSGQTQMDCASIPDLMSGNTYVSFTNLVLLTGKSLALLMSIFFLI